MIKSRENLIGARAFFAGVVLAILVGIFVKQMANPIVLGILAILGTIVGFTVSHKDIKTFLIASVSVVIASAAGLQGMLANAAILGIDFGRIMSSILGQLLVLFVPATIVVALKTVFSISAE